MKRKANPIIDHIDIRSSIFPDLELLNQGISLTNSPRDRNASTSFSPRTPRPVIASAIVSIIVPASSHFKFYKRVLKIERKE